ncbi:MAG: hypothetical protein ACI8W7_002278 [Gammaproteobacteria bacterium]|jgi:hypothetical protein
MKLITRRGPTARHRSENLPRAHMTGPAAQPSRSVYGIDRSTAISRTSVFLHVPFRQNDARSVVDARSAPVRARYRDVSRQNNARSVVDARSAPVRARYRDVSRQIAALFSSKEHANILESAFSRYGQSMRYTLLLLCCIRLDATGSSATSCY